MPRANTHDVNCIIRDLIRFIDLIHGIKQFYFYCTPIPIPPLSLTYLSILYFLVTLDRKNTPVDNLIQRGEMVRFFKALNFLSKRLNFVSQSHQNC